MSEQKLKPRPKCGSEARIGIEIDGVFVGYRVVCKVCQYSTSYNLKKQLVIEKWNRRAGEEEQ